MAMFLSLIGTRLTLITYWLLGLTILLSLESLTPPHLAKQVSLVSNLPNNTPFTFLQSQVLLGVSTTAPEFSFSSYSI